VASAKCVLFDFDGPVARLFAGYPAADVAGALMRQRAVRLDLNAKELCRVTPGWMIGISINKLAKSG
jgi:hypothetical protein